MVMKTSGLLEQEALRTRTFFKVFDPSHLCSNASPIVSLTGLTLTETGGDTRYTKPLIRFNSVGPDSSRRGHPALTSGAFQHTRRQAQIPPLDRPKSK